MHWVTKHHTAGDANTHLIDRAWMATVTEAAKRGDHNLENSTRHLMGRSGAKLSASAKSACKMSPPPTHPSPHPLPPSQEINKIDCRFNITSLRYVEGRKLNTGKLQFDHKF